MGITLSFIAIGLYCDDDTSDKYKNSFIVLVILGLPLIIYLIVGGWIMGPGCVDRGYDSNNNFLIIKIG